MSFREWLAPNKRTELSMHHLQKPEDFSAPDPPTPTPTQEQTVFLSGPKVLFKDPAVAFSHNTLCFCVYCRSFYSFYIFLLMSTSAIKSNAPHLTSSSLSLSSYLQELIYSWRKKKSAGQIGQKTVLYVYDAV